MACGASSRFHKLSTKMRRFLILPGVLLVGLAACVRNQTEYVVITTTPEAPVTAQGVDVIPTELPPVILPDASPTPDPTRPMQVAAARREYVVQPGDTLSGIASSQGITLPALMAVNTLIDPNVLSVGQVIQLPAPPDEQSSDFKIIPDSRLVRAPGSAAFDVAAFIGQQPGYIRRATDIVNGEVLTATRIVERVALEYSVDARLLLALLEYKGQWLSLPDLPGEAQTYPLGAQASPLGFDRNGLYRQLTWGANELNRGYYGWKYGRLTTIEFGDGERLSFAPGLNAGTVGLQYMLGLYNTYSAWEQQIEPEGFYRVYTAYFGDPFVNAVDPVVPAGVQQPEFALPFSSGEVWFFTGGPHGGWGSGSAWAAIDFAPPDDITQVSSSCYLSQYWATAIAPGVIARTDEGTVVLDLDGDGDESTGWSVLYLHIAEQDRISEGTQVATGDRIGRPSCEGGFSNGTHIHIGRRYNGEWIPADCSGCPPELDVPVFTMSGWRVSELEGQEYQGYIISGNERRVAEQGRLTIENLISW